MGHLGAVLHQVRRSLMIIRMPFRSELSQQHGYFHAGGLSAIADPAQGEFVEAMGRVVRAGRTLTVCQLEVFSRQQKKGSRSR